MIQAPGQTATFALRGHPSSRAMQVLLALAGLFGLASGASHRLRRQAEDPSPCGRCRLEFRQCLALPYGSVLAQAETNTFLSCSKEIKDRLLGKGFPLNIPGKVDKKAWDAGQERSDCFHDLLDYAPECQECYVSEGGDAYGLQDAKRVCAHEAEAAKEAVRLRSLRAFLRTRVRANNVCAACQQTVGACEELNFEDHYQKWDADAFSSCLADRLGDEFDIKSVLGMEPSFMTVYETTDFSDDPNAIREPYGNGNMPLGRYYCLKAQVFSTGNLCTQCMEEKGEGGMAFMRAVHSCQHRVISNPEESGGESFDKEDLEDEEEKWVEE